MHRSFPQQPHHRCQPPQRLAQRSIEFAVFPVRCAAARQLPITDLVHLPGPRRLLTHPSMRTWSFTGLPTGRHPSSAVRLSAASNPLSLPRHRTHVKSEVEEKLSKTFWEWFGSGEHTGPDSCRAESCFNSAPRGHGEAQHHGSLGTPSSLPPGTKKPIRPSRPSRETGFAFAKWLCLVKTLPADPSLPAGRRPGGPGASPLIHRT